MDILLTNDDGIHSPGIAILKDLLEAKGYTLHVVAPLEERSGVSQSITFRTPLRIQKVRKKGKFFGYGITGNPADCVKLGIKALLEKKPHWVLSGINNGYNYGLNLFYSGTVGGATEGIIQGVPAIAFSAERREERDFEKEGEAAVEVFEILQSKKRSPHTFWNVNIPPSPKGVLATCQSLDGLDEKFTFGKSPSGEPFYWLSGKFHDHDQDLSYDHSAVLEGYISITPVLVDRTSYEDLEKLEKWLAEKKKTKEEPQISAQKEQSL